VRGRVHETMESKCSCGAICIFARGLKFRQKYLFNFFFEIFLMHVMLCKYNIPCEKYLYKRILDENYFMVRKHLPKGLICMMILCMNVLSDPNEVTDAY
jgi:hypothetical protein